MTRKVVQVNGSVVLSYGPTFYSPEEYPGGAGYGGIGYSLGFHFAGSDVTGHCRTYYDVYNSSNVYGDVAMSYSFRLDQGHNYTVIKYPPHADEALVLPPFLSPRGGYLGPGIYTVSVSSSHDQLVLNFLATLTPLSGYAGTQAAVLRTTPPQPRSAAAEPVDTASGAFYLTRKLMNITGARDLGLEVSYNSGLLSAGSLGAGWSHNYEAALVQTGNAVIVQWNANRYNSFVATGATGAVFQGVEPFVIHDAIEHLTNGTWRLTRHSGDRWDFDPAGKLAVIRDRTGRALVITRDPTNGLVAEVAEPLSGRTLSFIHTNGILSTVNASDGRQVVFSVAGSRLLSHTLIAEDGTNESMYSYTYDAAGRVLTATSPDGNQILRNTYDGAGRVVRQEDGTSAAMTIGDVTIPAKTAALTFFAYDDSSVPGSRITTVTNRLGDCTTFKHDDTLNLVQVTDPGGQTTSYTYDSAGNVLTVTSPRESTTTNVYDDAGNRIRTIDADGNATSMTYDGSGNLLSVTNAAGAVTTFTYDSENHPLTTQDGASGFVGGFV